MKFHRKSAKGVAAWATAFATAAFLVQLAMPSALAVDAPTAVGSFFPVHSGASTDFANDFSGSTQMAVLSDKPNGVNTAARLTALSEGADTTNVLATLMNWYYCDTATLPGATGALCTLIATDSAATTAVTTAGYSGDTIDDAWSILWDIPASLDNLSKFIVAEGCNGTADATHSNCKADSVPGVLLDDSSTGATPQTSSGVITAPNNGSPVSQDTGVDPAVTASTSPELTAVSWGLDDCGDDSGGDSSPEGCSDVDENQLVTDLVPNTTTATARTWSGKLDSSSMDGDSESALTLFSTNDDMDSVTAGVQPGGVVSAICATCILATSGLAFDRIYVVQEPGSPGKAFDVFLKKTADVTADPTCTTGATALSAPAGSTVSLTGCMFDAFGDPVAGKGVFWAVVTGGQGSFTTSPPTVTDAKGQAVASVSAPASAVGTNTTVTFCVDNSPQNGVCDTPVPAGGSFTASIQITWTGPAGGGGHARSVTLKLSDGLNAAGKVKAAGFAACAKRVPVKVQKRVSGHWKTLKSVKTSATGAYKAHLANKHGKYRALAPRVTKAGDVCKRAVSPKRSH